MSLAVATSNSARGASDTRRLAWPRFAGESSAPCESSLNSSSCSSGSTTTNVPKPKAAAASPIGSEDLAIYHPPTLRRRLRQFGNDPWIRSGSYLARAGASQSSQASRRALPATRERPHPRAENMRCLNGDELVLTVQQRNGQP